MTITFAILTVASVAALEQKGISEHAGSFLETSMVERLRRAESEAQQKAKDAEAAWRKSREATDAILAKVRGEMATLNADLKATAEKQKQDLQLLESSRAKETAALKNTEAKLKELQNTATATETEHVNEKLVSSSLIEVAGSDFLAPLRKAAADAKAFAEKIRKESQLSRLGKSSSFLEGEIGEEDYASKAERSLYVARQALSKLDADLASQKHDLEIQLAKAQKDEEALRDGGVAGGVSFLQTEQQYDPLSPQALAEWRQKFNTQLQRAREAAGIKTPFKSSSLLETGFSAEMADEKMKEDENKVARLQEAFDAQMAKLKEDNAAMLAEAQAQIEKAKNMKIKLEADMRASSFLENPTGSSNTHHFNAEAEKEKIQALQRKWQTEAAQLTNPNNRQPSEAEKQLMNLIEDQKNKQATAHAELERLKQKLHKDIEVLHKDMSLSPSFLQVDNEAQSELGYDEEDYDDDEFSSFLESKMDFMEVAKDLFEKLKAFTNTDQMEAEPEIEAFPETDASADMAVAEEPAAVAVLGDVEEPVAVAPSFVELSSRDKADDALARAEEGLKKLQEKLRQQSADRAAYHSTTTTTI